jgi:hypothetical protein
MSLTLDEISALHGKSVIIRTATGATVSIGKVKVDAFNQDSLGMRVSVEFETPTMRCELGVPGTRLNELANSWDGDLLRYSLPPGDDVWLPAKERELPPAPTEATVETYPLPVEPPRTARPARDLRPAPKAK